MSLIKKHEMTEKHLAANRENQKLCNAPVTDERRERIRAAYQDFLTLWKDADPDTHILKEAKAE